MEVLDLRAAGWLFQASKSPGPTTDSNFNPELPKSSQRIASPRLPDGSLIAAGFGFTCYVPGLSEGSQFRVLGFEVSDTLPPDPLGVVDFQRRFKPTLEGLCVEAIFSSLFQPQFRAHEPGRKIADAASGHCHNSHTWPFGQEEVQLREFVSTLHVQPLSGPGNLAADEPHEHSESCTTPSPTARLLWHLQRALHQAACHATACARCLNIA